MFAGATRALKPGGRLVAITVNPGYTCTATTGPATA